MILSDQTLKNYIEKNIIEIHPLGPNAIQPASIDCRLGDHFLIADDTQMQVISMSEPLVYREVKAKEITIPPRSFILGTTMEYLKIPDDIVVLIEGRSSVGRMGLFIQNAGWVDPGFEGQLTLELYNANSLPIRLETGRRICQFVFAKMDAKAISPYRGKYQGQRNAVGTKINEDDEIKGS
ncbi:MAG: dCTP deaminase [Candidatus Dojkabacteria bacterium]|nr:MAG: dCTP deaminase [Candidatus Dojkabacteria bacterium]